jgi:hypothetical protein
LNVNFDAMLMRVGLDATCLCANELRGNL